MKDHIVVGIHITDRVQRAGDVQQILTAYGANIRTRLGLHHTEAEIASSQGLILLDTIGTPEDIDALCNQLRRLAGVQVQRMYFSHPQ